MTITLEAVHYPEVGGHPEIGMIGGTGALALFETDQQGWCDLVDSVVVPSGVELMTADVRSLVESMGRAVVYVSSGERSAYGIVTWSVEVGR